MVKTNMMKCIRLQGLFLPWQRFAVLNCFCLSCALSKQSCRVFCSVFHHAGITLFIKLGFPWIPLYSSSVVAVFTTAEAARSASTAITTTDIPAEIIKAHWGGTKGQRKELGPDNTDWSRSLQPYFPFVIMSHMRSLDEVERHRRDFSECS